SAAVTTMITLLSPADNLRLQTLQISTIDGDSVKLMWDKDELASMTTVTQIKFQSRGSSLEEFADISSGHFVQSIHGVRQYYVIYKGDDFKDSENTIQIQALLGNSYGYQQLGTMISATPSRHVPSSP